MARTLLKLSYYNTGFDDLPSRIVTTIYESTRKSPSFPQIKDSSDKKNPTPWSIDNLSRLFRELYSNLNWLKVFEALVEIEDEI